MVLLERNKLTLGTTWHAAGLVGQLRATYNLTRLAQYTTELYASLEQETGQSTGFRQNGSLAIASDKERFEEFVTAGSYTVEIAGQRYPATASLSPLYDPSAKRARG